MTAALFAPAAPASAALPDQGVYEGCGPALLGESTCLDRLSTIAGGGFDVVLNYTAWYGNASQVRAYADRAAAAGVKIIWPFNAKQWRDGSDLRKHYRYLSPDCGCTDNDGFTQFVVNLVKDHPATWGYYIGDEAPASEVDGVRAVRDRIRALDPAHPSLFVSLEDSASLGDNLRPFADVPDVLASDVYPVGTHHPLSSVGDVSREVRGMADARGKRSAMVLQSFDWSQYGVTPAPGHSYRWPTTSEMRSMRDSAILEGRPDLILWYSYQDIVRSDDPALRWQNLRAAAFAPEPSRSEPPAPQPAPAPGPESGPAAGAPAAEPPVLSATRFTRTLRPRTDLLRLRRALRRCKRVRSSRSRRSCRSRARRSAARRTSFRWRLSAPATVQIRIQRVDRRRVRVSGRVRMTRRLRTMTVLRVSAAAGRGHASIPRRVSRRLRRGSYVARIEARSEAGKSRRHVRRFHVR